MNTSNIYALERSIISIARNLVGRARWKYGARAADVPAAFDCSALTKWVYAQKGVWLPRTANDQFAYCSFVGTVVPLASSRPGDLLFTTSPYRHGKAHEPDGSIGHVFLISVDGHAICATNSELGTGVVELPLDRITATRTVCAVARPYK